MPRVLVIDDNADIREMLLLKLQLAGFHAREAADGEQALHQLAAEPADIIITDLFMPEKDGVETITEIRERYPDVSIIAMSGWQSPRGPDYLAVAREIGAIATLRKPFDPDELLRIVHRVEQDHERL